MPPVEGGEEQPDDEVGGDARGQRVEADVLVLERPPHDRREGEGEEQGVEERGDGDQCAASVPTFSSRAMLLRRVPTPTTTRIATAARKIVGCTREWCRATRSRSALAG